VLYCAAECPPCPSRGTGPRGRLPGRVLPAGLAGAAGRARGGPVNPGPGRAGVARRGGPSGPEHAGPSCRSPWPRRPADQRRRRSPRWRLTAKHRVSAGEALHDEEDHGADDHSSGPGPRCGQGDEPPGPAAGRWRKPRTRNGGVASMASSPRRRYIAGTGWAARPLCRGLCAFSRLALIRRVYPRPEKRPRKSEGP